ncbi:HSF-type DNA-binding-domain-containing protein [Dichotomocladium elegans]|nr:HSF-type DNA-binding-domain-containing protein [Dichotomocladium elegans]
MEISKHHSNSNCSNCSTNSSQSRRNTCSNNNINNSDSNNAIQLGILFTGHERRGGNNCSSDSKTASIGSDTTVGFNDARANSEAGDPHLSSLQSEANDPERTAAAMRTQAAFVNKLYKMLEDPAIHHLICWSENGELFSVRNPTAFSKTVLPQYFKHNNWQSFVRQLNMYGFHKVNDMIHSNLTAESQNWEFRHPHFRRGAVDELKNIKRKSAKSRHLLPNRTSTPSNLNEGDELLYGPMYHHMLSAEERLLSASKAFEILQQQISNLKTIISGQQEIIGSTVDVMMSLCQEDPVSRAKVENMKQRYESLILSTKSSPFIPPAPEPPLSLGDTNRTLKQPFAATATLASSTTSSSPIPNNNIHSLSHHRLPPINVVHAGVSVDGLDTTMLNPPLGYIVSGSRGDAPAAIMSNSPSLLQDSIDRKSPGEDRHYTSSYLGLGRQSHILNPEPLLPASSSELKSKGIKRIMPDTA